MPERLTSHEKILRALQTPTKALIADIPELECMLLVPVSAQGLNISSGTIVTNDGRLSLKQLFLCKAQLLKLHSKLDDLLATLIRQEKSDKTNDTTEPIRHETAEKPQPA